MLPKGPSLMLVGLPPACDTSKRPSNLDCGWAGSVRSDLNSAL